MKRFFSVFIAFLFFVAGIFAETEKLIDLGERGEIPQAQGRIIVLVVDISQSIKNQLDLIIGGLKREIVEKRLGSGDYCVVVPLGDKSVVEKADSFGVRYSRDKEKIADYLSKIGTWSSGNLNTDIGAAMQKTFDFISMIDAENSGEMCEPLVLFITDGEIYESPNSKEKVALKTPEDIFSDSKTNPALHSYANWWFLGIENEGVPLEHIKRIAEGAGALSRYETLSDMEQFGALFDLWLSSIPDPAPRDKGGVKFDSFEFGGAKLGDNNATIPTNAKKLTFSISNTYSRTDLTLRKLEIKAVFQSESTGISFEIPIKAEAGNIVVNPGKNRKTEGFAELPKISGKGRLKISFDVLADGGAAGEIPEMSFSVNFKSPAQILFQKIAIPVAAVLILALLIFAAKIAKLRAAIKIQMEIVGKTSKTRAVSMRIRKRCDIGTKPSADFKLEGNFALVAATIERTGASSWKIAQREAEISGANLESYKLGSPVKILARNGESVTVKFRRRK